VRTVHGPKENRNRPSVDVLFRSAALAYGPRVVAVVLSGTLDDGASGLVAVKRHGGVAIVQEPADAHYPGMPLRALENVDADHCVPASEMGQLLARLVTEDVRRTATPGDEVRATEVRMVHGFDDEMEKIGRPSIFTCPECTGVLWEVDEPEVLRFRCRVGHAYTSESLLSGQEETQEAALWAGMRALEENAKLSERMAERFRARQQSRLAERMATKAQIAQAQAKQIRDMIETMPQAGVGAPEGH
jgi:two-component system, chemotaxis family, protein-glutamate methylesterase/glutaminase